jgi:imidazolonepropionase
VPIEHRGERRRYVDLVVHEMIPRVAGAGLASWCDVFCETGVFTPEESEEILRAGAAAGLRPRVHADELGASGGSFVAARVGARSADHLIFVPPEGIRQLAAAGVVATLLPSAAFYLKLGRFAPARVLIEADVPVALATDVNPGGGFSPSMPFVMALGCFSMGMTLEESLSAATINAAYALDRHREVGSLEPGKVMDAVFVRGGLPELVRVGAPAIARVVKRGRTVVAIDG